MNLIETDITLSAQLISYKSVSFFCFQNIVFGKYLNQKDGYTKGDVHLLDTSLL